LLGDRIGKDDIGEEFQQANHSPTISRKSKDKNTVDIGESLAGLRFAHGSRPPTSQTWLNKYASSNLSYLKDLNIAFNSITQLGAVYTGGKYESLLNKKGPRKSLNDDDLKLF
jgi:hypothetical protein